MLSLLSNILLLSASQDFNPKNSPDRIIGEIPLDARSGPGETYPLPSLAIMGKDAIRFVTRPALRGGERDVVTIRPLANGIAVARVDTL